MMTNHYSKSNSNTVEASKDSIKIGVATTPQEKKEIYHFRYQIYVEEMSKQIASVDHINKLLYDEMDEWSMLLYAKIGSELIATARINIGTLTDFPQQLVERLSMDTFLNCNTENIHHQFSYCAKLMVAPSHRSSPTLYLLIARCYELSYHNQVQFGFLACNFHLLRLYEQMGFHRYSNNFVDPGYGLLTPIVLVVDDIQHLRTVRSPLFRVARKRGIVNTQAVEWFHAKFIKPSNIINSQVVIEEELWSIVCNRLNCPPTESIAILGDLSIAEAKKFLHSCGILVQCNPGNIITNQGDVSYSYNIVMSGRLKSLTFLHPVKEYTLPGQNFGANGLTELNKHTEDIAAIDSSEILVLSGIAFQKFYHSYPEIAHKIVQRIGRLTKNKPLSIK